MCNKAGAGCTDPACQSTAPTGSRTQPKGVFLQPTGRFSHRMNLRSAMDRQGLLVLALSIGCVNTLVFYWLPWSGFDRNLNLLVFFVFLGLLAIVLRTGAIVLPAHLLIAASFAALIPMVSQTGGINSPNIVWMPVLAMAALLLINLRSSLVWLGIILAHNLLQFWAVESGWVSGVVNPATMPLHSALLSKLNILLFVILALGIYDLQYRSKMQEVSLRNAELEATQRALLDAQNHKDEFIASVGHELRTPMNAILGLNGVLLDELAGHRQQAETARYIRDATMQLLRVVNDILDISQSEAGRLVLHTAPFALAPALAASVAAYAPAARDKGLSLSGHWDIGDKVHVMGDRQRFVHVLNHLLDNAVKFTAQGSVALHAQYTQGVVRVQVKDTGDGIDAAVIPSIFDRFHNASLQMRKVGGGAGLGLAVCQQLVQSAGGSIGVRARQSGGNCFWLEWPMPHSQAPASQGASSTERMKNVLVVDDHPMNQMVVQLLLKKWWPHCQVEVVGNGRQALQAMDKQTYDLVLMDIFMPGLDGIDTTRHMREHPDPRLRTTPVIGLTANNLGSDAQRCMDAGMQAVVFKPIDQGELYATVVRVLESEPAP